MAYGDIGSLKTAVLVKEGTCASPYPIQVGLGVFAVFYQQGGTGLVLKTYSSDAAGAITGISTTDTVVDAEGASDIHVIHISGTIYVAVYRGEDGKPWVTTVDIAANGTINDASVARHSCYASGCTKPHICWVRTTVYAIVFDVDSPAAGGLKTITISTDGTTIADADYWQFITNRIYFSSPFRLSDGYITIPYQGATGYSDIFSVHIAASGVITENKITNWECDPMTNAPWAIRVGSQQYAITCTGLGGDGFCLSVSIADNGVITQSWDDQLEFDTVQCQTNMIISIGGIYYAVCYIGFSNHWELATFWITAEGAIRNSNIDSLDTGLPTAAYARWCWVRDNIYVIAWEDAANDIFATPVDIESFGFETMVRHEMMMGM